MSWAVYRVVAVTLVLCAAASLCDGQAWVPAKGEGEFSIVFQSLYTSEHFNGDGSRFKAGNIRLLGLVNATDFGVTDKLAISASLPVFAGAYHGDLPHQFPIDNGNYHGSIQDFRFAVRYMTRERPLVFTPFLGFSLPAHDYEHFAHSAIGTSMWEIGIGMNVGRRLDPILPNAYFQTRYTYVITQRIIGIRPNRSRVDAELGYFLTPRVSVRALAGSQITHSGLDFPDDFPSQSRKITNPLWHHHDQISAINYLNLGGGVGIAVTNSLDVFATMATSVWGQNGHALNQGLSVGMSWSFRTPWAKPQTRYAQLTPSWRIKPNEIKPCH